MTDNASSPVPLATIVACATGEGGWSERSLIRLSGPACGEVERSLLSRPTGARSCFTARFRLTDSLDLPCLAWSARGPRTFTGEDSLELLIPGSPLVVRRVIDRLCAGGQVRPAVPGEFSARAYHNGKLTLEQAEGIAAVIAAENASQLAASAMVMSGETGAVHRGWSEEVATLLALVEAGIDFSDQDDVVAIRPGALRERVEAVRAAIAGHLGAAAGRESPRGLVRVALAGRPNAGKSTLFNALLGRTRAVATPIAGTTRDVLAEPLALRAAHGVVEIELMDLPGLDAYATGSDALGQESAHGALASAQIVLHCCDRGRFDALPGCAALVRTVRVRTKADQPGWVEGADVAVCALTGLGLSELRRVVAIASRGSGVEADRSVVPRHARALRAAAESLECVDALGQAELAAHHLRAALDAIGEVSGAVPRDEVIGRVFASFCIGK